MLLFVVVFVAKNPVFEGLDAGCELQAKDELRNKRLAGGDTFIVWLEGPATVHASVDDRNDGTYIAAFKSTIVGLYDLYITNGGPLSCRSESYQGMLARRDNAVNCRDWGASSRISLPSQNNSCQARPQAKYLQTAECWSSHCRLHQQIHCGGQR